MESASAPKPDPVHHLLRRRQALDAIFYPRTVAVIGATDKPGSVGGTILRNLITTPFGGTVYPVNPRRINVLGIRAYPAIAQVPESVDLAVVVTPAPTVPDVVDQCAAAGVRGLVIISAGFKEVGAEGAALEERIRTTLANSRMRCIGPNCLGVMMPRSGLNATFAATMARPGSVGFISQSGALCTAVLDWSLRENTGFAAFISVGSMLDVGVGDLIDYLGDDPHVKSIVIYLESIGDPHAFMSAARENAIKKPIIVIKAGRTAAAAQAAASHTGSLTGSDEVLEAAFRRCGVLRVNTIAELFYMAEVLGKQPRPAGPRLTILTNAGGPGVLATDALLTTGGQLAPLSDDTRTQLDRALPPQWSHDNPIDILGDASPDRYASTLRIAARSPDSDGMLVILTPQAMTDPTQTAQQLKQTLQDLSPRKPVLASWMGGADVAAGVDILNRADIPTFDYPDTAARVFSYMWRYTYNLRGLYETPSSVEDPGAPPPDRQSVRQLIQHARSSGNLLLTEAQSKQLLQSYGIPVTPARVAESADQAVHIADVTGYPVVVKLHSLTITHKTEVGGVHLNLGNADAVQQAFNAIQQHVRDRLGAEHFQGVTVQPMIDLSQGYELIVGSSIDAQFGPVLLFGAGGQLVEVFRDRSLGLPPLNTTLARRMMEQTRIYKALQGVRGRPPVDMDALEKLLVRFSQLVVEQPWIREIDINPLWVSHERMLALDARVILHGPEVTADQLPRLAISPYPSQYVAPFIARDGTRLVIRPLRPEDEPAVRDFHCTLSEETIYMRYFRPMSLQQRVSHDRLAQICFVDYDREMVLAVVHRDPATQKNQIAGIGRLSKFQGVSEAEFALLVADAWQGRGLGTELLRRLIAVARDQNIARVVATILRSNVQMQRVCREAGFELQGELEDDEVTATLRLRDESAR